MAKKARSKKSAKGPKGSFDRHVVSALVGIALGAGAFYAKRSMDSKSSATA
jgi:hypothetical protein